MKPKDIRAIVLKMRPPTGVYGNMNTEEWRLEKAAELGYMAALCDVGIISRIGYSHVGTYFRPLDDVHVIPKEEEK